MPQNIESAIRFLETQWSNINDNKEKGIKAETAFRDYLENNNIHFIPGGWLLTPGKNTLVKNPSQHKICLLPVEINFSWQASSTKESLTPAQISAYNYFRQVGVTTYFVFPDEIDEESFLLPQKRHLHFKAKYPTSYSLKFKSIAPNGSLTEVPFHELMCNFPPRNGNMGLRCYEQGRISRKQLPWNNSQTISALFWFEYSRYYCQVDYLVSNNDLDLFILGVSGSTYPVELKSKSPVIDPNLGDWFGLDIGAFAKMAFFTANSMNTDALYVVQEVDEQRDHVTWLGIRFTDLVKNCSWIVQTGGKSMTGGSSSTIKVPKMAFTELGILLPEL